MIMHNDFSYNAHEEKIGSCGWQETGEVEILVTNVLPEEYQTAVKASNLNFGRRLTRQSSTIVTSIGKPIKKIG